MRRVPGKEGSDAMRGSCQVTRIVFPATFSAEDDDSLVELCTGGQGERNGREERQMEAGEPINKFVVPTSGNLSACLISPVSPA